MNEKQTIIEAEGLSLSFGNKKVLDGVSFNINEGEITVILGGSGSGKTTIFRSVLGLLEPEKGSIHVFDKELTSMDESELLEYYMKIGVFYQEGALLSSMTVGENIALALEQHTSLPTEIIHSMVSSKLNLVGLPEVESLYPSELSGGMLKRAALARAIIRDPKLLLCDEPGAGLDPVSLSALDDLILNLKNQLGMTILMVTHEVSSIQRIADKIIFLEEGQVVFEGSLQNALNSSVSSVKNFFSAASDISTKKG